MRADVYVPLSEGIVRTNSRESTMLLSRAEPETGQPLPADRYLELVREQREKEPALVQMIVRAMVAAALAKRESSFNQSCLLDVDGRKHAVGGIPVGGVAKEVWRRQLPQELGIDVLPRAVLRHAAGVRGDIQTILAALGSDPGSVTLIVGQRAIPIAQEEFQRSVRGIHVLRTLTPRDGANRTRQIAGMMREEETPFEQFVDALAEAGETEVPQTAKDRIAYGAFRRVYRRIEKLMGEELDVGSRLERILWPTIPPNGDASSIAVAEGTLRQKLQVPQVQEVAPRRRRHSGRK